MTLKCGVVTRGGLPVVCCCLGDSEKRPPQNARPSLKPDRPRETTPAPRPIRATPPPESLKPRIPANVDAYLRARGNVVCGVALDELQTSTKRLKTDIERSGYSQSFSGVLPDRHEGIEITVTNDYEGCEMWCRELRQEKPRLLGVRLHHVLIPAPPPLPSLKTRPKRRYRMENRPSPPPPLNPGGPLRLREGGTMIGCLTLATENRVLLLQLRQMRVIGPELRQRTLQPLSNRQDGVRRAILESPFIQKGGPDLIALRRVLREDGVQLIGGDDILRFFLRRFPRFEEREEMKKLAQKAGYQTFMHSITGVEIEEDIAEIPCYLWGEPDLADDLVLLSAREAWSCWIFLKLMQETSPETVPAISGIAPSYM